MRTFITVIAMDPLCIQVALLEEEDQTDPLFSAPTLGNKFAKRLYRFLH